MKRGGGGGRDVNQMGTTSIFCTYRLTSICSFLWQQNCSSLLDVFLSPPQRISSLIILLSIDSFSSAFKHTTWISKNLPLILPSALATASPSFSSCQTAILKNWFHILSTSSLPIYSTHCNPASFCFSPLKQLFPRRYKICSYVFQWICASPYKVKIYQVNNSCQNTFEKMFWDSHLVRKWNLRYI